MTTRKIVFAFLLSGLSFCAVADDTLPDHAMSASQMSVAAVAFVDTLTAEQREAAVFPLKHAERPTWSNLPIRMVRPSGILVGDLDDGQRAAFHDLLRASMSSQGYAKLAGIMRLDDLLFEIEMARLVDAPDDERTRQRREFSTTRDSGNYAVGVYGDPADDDWGWKVSGHHGAANFTVSDGRVGFTPTFVGSNPLTVEAGKYAGWMALSHEGSRGVELMLSLTAEQQAAARLAAENPDDIFEGPGRRGSLDSYQGIRTDELSVGQMRLLQALVSEYVRNSDFDAAEAQLELIGANGWEDLWFSWSGPVDVNGAFYYRVHGPRILIEYNRQNPNHDHAIIRDPQNDYGEDWLAHHYNEFHRTL